MANIGLCAVEKAAAQAGEKCCFGVLTAADRRLTSTSFPAPQMRRKTTLMVTLSWKKPKLYIG
jgi:hypothetical protein